MIFLSILRNIRIWHSTKLGYFGFAFCELILAFIFSTLAVDTGSLWFYILAVILLVGVIQNIVKLIGIIFHVGKSKKT